MSGEGEERLVVEEKVKDALWSRLALQDGGPDGVLRDVKVKKIGPASSQGAAARARGQYLSDGLASPAITNSKVSSPSLSAPGSPLPPLPLPSSAAVSDSGQGEACAASGLTGGAAGGGTESRRTGSAGGEVVCVHQADEAVGGR